MERDIENEQLGKEGWTILRFWDKEIKKDVAACTNQIEEAVRKNI